jgi:hypothetical protein
MTVARCLAAIVRGCAVRIAEVAGTDVERLALQQQIYHGVGSA